MEQIKLPKTEEDKTIIYTYLLFDGKRFKIGKTINLKKRFQSLKTSNPDLTLLGYTDLKSENYFHTKYKNFRYKLEWFDFPMKMVPSILEEFENKDKDIEIRFYRKHDFIKVDDKFWIYNPTSYSLNDYEKFIDEDGKYKIGKFSFNSKDDIVKFNRSLLHHLKPDEKITDKNIISFVKKLATYNSSYKELLENDKIVSFKTKLDIDCNPSENSTFNNFCIIYASGKEWNFSSRHAIKNIPIIKDVSVKKQRYKYIIKRGSKFILNFGKYKNSNLEEILIKDKEYIRWAYTTIIKFKTEINKTKYKNLVKINV